MNQSNPDSSAKANASAWLKQWWAKHHERLISIADTPHSIALGVAVGVFFGFTPLWSMKTLLSIAVAWLLNSNKVAAAISVTLHDVILPFMPAIYWWEYKFGYWALHGGPPQRIHFAHIAMRRYFDWHVFTRVIWPALLGSVFLALPSAILVYFLARWTVKRTRAHRLVLAGK